MQEPTSIRIDLVKRKKIRLQSDTRHWTYHVLRGCLTIDAILPGNRRQVMLILYPGDVISRAAIPPLSNVVLTAVLPSSLMRTTHSAPPREAPCASRSEMKIAMRSSLHGIIIGRLTSEERLSSLLIEMALYLGTPVNGGYTFELPLTRADMADYLALNPDTLSRLLTKFRSREIISLPSRHRVIIRNMSALSDLSPISDALRQVRDEGGPALS